MASRQDIGSASSVSSDQTAHRSRSAAPSRIVHGVGASAWGTLLGAVAVAVAAALAGCGEAAPENRRAEWVLAEERPDELRVAVFVGGSTCTDYDRVEVVETGDEVRVEAFVWRDDAGACSEDFGWLETPVPLEEPLGDRVLLGCADDEVEVRGWDRPPGSDCRELGLIPSEETA